VRRAGVCCFGNEVISGVCGCFFRLHLRRTLRQMSSSHLPLFHFPRNSDPWQKPAPNYIIHLKYIAALIAPNWTFQVIDLDDAQTGLREIETYFMQADMKIARVYLLE
jgi:hypothetical protein